MSRIPVVPDQLVVINLTHTVTVHTVVHSFCFGRYSRSERPASFTEPMHIFGILHENTS